MRKFILIWLLLALFACSEEKNTPLGDAISGDDADSAKQKEYEFQRVQDSILKNYSDAVKLINQIDTELSKLGGVGISNESHNLEIEILQKIDYLSFQLQSRNEEIHKLEIKLKSLGKENKEYLERIKTLESIIAEKDVIMANQTSRIENLENELSITKSERDVALVEKQNIEQFADKTVKDKNTAYYIIGKEKELETKNIIKMEGEGFLGIGGRFVPAIDSDLKLFTKIDILSDTLLPVPNNVKKIEVISSHNKRLLDIHKSESGTDFLKIRTPETFWRTDKMLIIIIEEK